MGLFNFGKKKENITERKPVSKRFHLVITNNETGEVMSDENTNGIIGVFLSDADIATGIFSTYCTKQDAAGMLVACMKHIDTIAENNPMLKLIMEMVSTEIKK